MAQTPLDKLAAVSPTVAEGFKALRKGVFDGPLDEATIELVVVGALAATGQQPALRVHVKRLLALDVPPESIRQAIVSTLAAASTLTPTVAALDVVQQVVDEQASS